MVRQFSIKTRLCRAQNEMKLTTIVAKLTEMGLVGISVGLQTKAEIWASAPIYIKPHILLSSNANR